MASRFLKKRSLSEEDENEPGEPPGAYQVIKTSFNKCLREKALQPYIVAVVDHISLTSIRGSRIYNAFLRHLADRQLLESCTMSSLRSILAFAWTNGVAKIRQPESVELRRLGFYAWWKEHESSFEAYRPSFTRGYHDELLKDVNIKPFADTDYKAYQRSILTHLKTTLPGKLGYFTRASMLSATETHWFYERSGSDEPAEASGSFVLVARRRQRHRDGSWYQDVTAREARKACNAVLGWTDDSNVHPILRGFVAHERWILFGNDETDNKLSSRTLAVHIGRFLAYQTRLSKQLLRMGTFCHPQKAEMINTKVFCLAPESAIKQRHITIDNEGLFQLLWGSNLYRPHGLTKVAAWEQLRDDEFSLGCQWEAAFDLRPKQTDRSFFKSNGRGVLVSTDSVSASVMYLQPLDGEENRYKPWEQRNKNCAEMPVHGELDGRPVPDPTKTYWAVDPGRVQLVTAVKVYPPAASGSRPETRTLSRRQFYRGAHYTQCREKDARARGHLQPAYELLAAHSRKTPDHQAYLNSLAAESSVFLEVWQTHSRRAAGAYRLEKHIYSNRVLDRFWASFGDASDQVILYGAAKIQAGGRGEVSVPVKGVLRRCRRFFQERLVLVDEYGSTKFCSVCDSELLKDMRRQLLVAEKVKRRRFCEDRGLEDDSGTRLTTNRGLQRCSTCSNNRLVSRDLDAALMIGRCYFDRPAVCCRRVQEQQ